jgi:PAS domain S-box-containing protein
MRFSELVDIGELQSLCQSFTEATGIVTAILDLDGEILSATGWQRICTRFHRAHWLSAERCRESDTVLASQLRGGQSYNVYRCRNGLVDVAVPILVDGEHLANFFIGQFFFEPPDQQYFVRQAEEFGFDKAAYLESLALVPVYSEAKVRSLMDFLAHLARLMGEMGLARKRVEHVNAQLQEYQEHLEELVRERTADLNRAQEIAHVGSWRWDIKTDAVAWSDEMYRIFGLQPGEPANPTYETFHSRVRPDERESVGARMREAIDARCSFTFDFHTIPIDGRERTVRVFGGVRCEADGEPVELFGADQDITEEERRQEALAEAKEKAEAANRAKSAFLASMSHELRTPLNVILGFSRLLGTEANVTNARRESLDVIARSGEHLLNLVNNVLNISKIEAGYVECEKTGFDLPQFIDAVALLMRAHAAEKGLEFHVEQSPHVPRYVLADAGKLRQVLINLLGNAIKYTSCGRIALRVLEAPPATPQQTRLRFEVADTGIGIATEDRQRLFVPFVQLADRPRTESGSGLGLAISKQYIELMGGQIGLTSEPGRGSVFSFEIPVELASADEMPAEPIRGRVTGLAPGQPRYRILIAEDHRENRQLLRNLLEPLGFELREAANGQEAVALSHEWRPHLIWMDIRMPVIDGKEASRRIRAAASGASPRIIALTAHALEEECREILEAGCDDLVRKPYRDSEIYNALAKHLGVRFVFGEADASGPEEVPSLQASELAALPADWLEELAGAVERLDSHACLAVVERIRQHDPRLGERLHRMVKGLQFKRLLATLDDWKGRKDP